jgi:peptidyl-prolyl cis-trans isomerase SurA
MILRPITYSAVLLLGTASFAALAYGQAPTTSFPAAQQSPYGGQTVEEIIVQINDQIITRSDYERAQQQLEADARQQGMMPQEIEARKRDLLRDLIDQQLLLSKGKELGITGETELIKRLDEIRKQYHMDTLEDLERAAKEQGVSFEDFKAKIRNDIVTQEVVREEVGRKLQVTPGEVQRYYAAHQADFTRPESVRLSEILISTGTPAPSATEKGATVADDPQRLATAKAKADDVEAKLKAGDSFETVARSYSDGPTAAQGGDLGNFKRGTLAKELEDKTFALKAGEFTEPTRTKQGYIILKVSEHTPGGVPDLKEVYPQVEESMYMQRMQPKLREYLTQLREQAYVDTKAGYVDSGSSVKQTKPVYSAYVPPAPKKKKKVQRVRFREKSRTVQAPKEAQNAPALPPASTNTKQAPNAADSQSTAPAEAPNAASHAQDANSINQQQAAGNQQQPKSAEKDKNGQVASSGSMKPGKKEKIRYGQAPRETLPKGAETKKEDAGAQPDLNNSGNSNVAANDAQEPANPLEPEAKPQQKTRFSYRAKAPKEKTEKGPKVDPLAPAAPDAEDVADRQTQSAPLGLNGDTANTKKPKKQKAETGGQKTRYSDTAREKKDQQPAQQPNQPAAAPATTDQSPNTQQPATTPTPQPQ